MPHDSLGAGADGCAPVEQAARSPFHVRATRGRHVFGDGRVFAFEARACVHGDTLAAMQDLHAVACDARPDLLPCEVVRDAVIVAADIDVVIDVHTALLEAGDLERRTGNARSTGWSSRSNHSRRLPSSRLNGRWFRSATSPAIALLSSARL
jgi:hypothetical protein